MYWIALVHQNHAFAGIAVRSPEPVVLVFANRTGQPILRSKIVDSPCLAVVAGFDAGLSLHLRRQAVIYACDLDNHRLPAQFVRIVLRQRRARVAVLADRRRIVDCLLKSHVTFDTDDGSENWQQRQERYDKYYNECRFQPAEPRPLFQPRLADKAPSREQHGIRGGKVIVLPMQDGEDGERHNVSPCQDAVLASLTTEEQPQQARYPEGKRKRVGHSYLLQKKSERAELNIPATLVDVVHQLHERPVMTDIPEKIRQEYSKRYQAADPNPLMRERFSFGS